MSGKCSVVVHSSVEWINREVGGKRMSDRQNTTVCVFDPRSPRVTAFHIQELIHEIQDDRRESDVFRTRCTR